MDFRLTPEQFELKETARRFARDKLPAVAEQCENSNTPPSRELIREYADMSFRGINVPAELGGLGLGNLEAARLLIYRLASNAEDGLPSVLDSSIAKCYASDIARTGAGNAVQMTGCYGYSREYPMERRLRDAWGWGIAGGAVDVQKVTIASAMAGRRFDQRR